MRPQAVDYLQAALKAASLRQSAIAQNIANLNTPGYRRAEVRFESLLEQALRDGDAEALAGVQPAVVRAGGLAGGPDAAVDLDREVGELIKNSMLTKTYFRLLGKVIQQMELAIGS